jgi:hypothetical protein
VGSNIQDENCFESCRVSRVSTVTLALNLRNELVGLDIFGFLRRLDLLFPRHRGQLRPRVGFSAGPLAKPKVINWMIQNQARVDLQDVDNLLATRPRSEASPPRRNPMVHHGTRDRNQARSETSFELTKEPDTVKPSGPPNSADGLSTSGRSRLWFELRDVQQTSRISTDRLGSPMRKPP